MTATDDTALEVRADVPATVAATSVRPGDPVGAGDQLALLESMKMEIPVLCEVDGVVASVVVGAGDTVRTGELLATITPDGPDRAPA
jgi:acetyl-CoA carboxylase biotin carboxyl carrier protein